jgi:hypothetical protein
MFTVKEGVVWWKRKNRNIMSVCGNLHIVKADAPPIPARGAQTEEIFWRPFVL